MSNRRRVLSGTHGQVVKWKHTGVATRYCKGSIPFLALRGPNTTPLVNVGTGSTYLTGLRVRSEHEFRHTGPRD